MKRRVALAIVVVLLAISGSYIAYGHHREKQCDIADAGFRADRRYGDGSQAARWAAERERYCDD